MSKKKKHEDRGSAQAGRVATTRSKRFIFLLLVIAILALISLVFYKFIFHRFSLQDFWQKEGIRQPNVILVTMDTTRADHLPLYGYGAVETPNLNELGSKGVVFEQCATASPLTLPAHCSILTGFYPPYHGVRVNGNNALRDDLTTLAEVFSLAGYQTAAFIAAFVLDGRWGLKQGFDYYDDQFDLKKYKQLDLGQVQRPGDEVVNSALDWLGKNSGAPFFAWVHLYDPHLPYQPSEPYFSRYNYSPPFSLYDGEIASMDEQIGRLYKWLKGNGLENKTIIVLVGDHGEGLGEHGELAHGYFIYDYAVHVPLIISTPDKKLQNRRVQLEVSTVDIFPTLLEMTGLKARSGQGRSLLPVMSGRKEKEIPAYCESMSPSLHYGWSPLLGLRTSHFKFIDAPRPELYDLKNDPGEQHEVQNKFPGAGLNLKRELDSLLEKIGQGAPEAQAANLDAETVQRLAALGYIGSSVKLDTRPAKELADPKDKLEVYELIQQAGDFINHDQYQEAAAFLEQALSLEPVIPQARLLLSTCYVELGRREEAKKLLDNLLKEDPDSIQALIGLANLLLEEGQDEAVISLSKKALSLDERNIQACTLIGEVYLKRQEPVQALPYLEKALVIQPKITRNEFNLALCLAGLKQYSRAEELLTKVLSDYPRFPLANYHLGVLYEEEGRLVEASQAYQREVEYYPNHYRARFNLGKIKLTQGDFNGYMEEMKKVIELAPQEAEGYLFYARGKLLQQDDLAVILSLINNGLRLAKTAELKALGYFLLADVYNRLGQAQKVEEALARAGEYKNQTESQKNE
ncbi:MAG: sulfatase-like hydrolase/transferase [Acidobacteriota bacterium]|nr:sulfatase-like hydrolase/transferase [Acidobacteriota bacterium]